jgi:ribosomal protein S18 acetylase RimI-like enzyme
MNEISITKLQEVHIAELLPLLQQQYEILNTFYPTFYHPWSSELEEKVRLFLKRVLEEEHQGAFVAIVDGRVAGLITYTTAQRGHFDTVVQEFVDITELIVDSSFRSMGIGQTLIEAVKEIVKQKGMRMLRVVVSAKNTRGISFYERAGFDIRELVGFMEV